MALKVMKHDFFYVGEISEVKKKTSDEFIDFLVIVT